MRKALATDKSLKGHRSMVGKGPGKASGAGTGVVINKEGGQEGVGSISDPGDLMVGIGAWFVYTAGERIDALLGDPPNAAG